MQPSRTILLMEEDLELRSAIRDLLERMDYWVVAALRAERVPRVFDMADTVDLLVSDVTVPDSDSLALTEELLSRRAELGAVLIGTEDTELEVRRRFRDHRTRFLRKPFSVKELQRVVEEAGTARLEPEAVEVANDEVRADRDAPDLEVAGRAPRRLFAAWGLAAAAVLVLFTGVLMRVVAPSPPVPDLVESSVMRGTALNGLEPKGNLSERPARLRWDGVAGAASYRIRILAIDDTPLWEGASRGTDVALSEEVTDVLHPGVVYYWMVEALDTEGEVRARSKSARFQVIPSRSRRKG